MGGAESYGGTDSGMLTFHTQNGYVVSAIPPERMRITSAGNVGIGTTSPSARLHVYQGASGNSLPSNAQAVFEYDANGGISISTPTGNAAGVYFSYSTSPYYAGIDRFETNLRVFSGNAERMRITSGGNVGIGTTSPTGHMLDIASTQGDVNNSAIRALFPAGGGLLNTEFGALAYRGGVWTAVYGKQGAASSAAYFDGNVGVGTASPGSRLEISGTTGSYNSGIGFVPSGTGARNYRTYIATDGSFNFDDATASVTRINLSSTGNVGIGTTTPGATYSEKLQVLGSSLGRINVTHTTTSDPRQSDILFTENDTITFQVGTVLSNGTYGDQNWLRGVGSLPVTIHTDSLERFRVTSSGNVGIGTTSPGQKLTVDGTAAAYSAIGASDNVRTGLAQYDTSLQAAGVGGQLVLGYKYTNAEDFTEGAIIKMYKENGTSGAFGSGLKFQVRNDGANLSTKLILDPSGNLGVGTTSPSYKVDVSGDINFSSTLKFAGTTVLSNSGTDVYANIRVIRSQSTIADGMYINYDSDGGANADIRFFANGQNERMRIDASNGNVGIGTTIPAAKLTVVGATTVIGQTNVVARFSDDFNSTLLISHPASTSAAATITGNEQLAFATGAVGNIAERMRITSAGNVGIGTTIPGSRLQVTATSNSATTVDNGITILNDSGINNCLAGIRLSTYGDSDGGLYPKQFIGAIRDGNFGAGKGSIVFCNRDAADTSVVALSDEKMRILPNGNVGIGTTAPSSKLHIDNALGADVISISDNAGSVRLALGQESSYTGNYIDSKNIDLKLKSALAGGSGGNIFFQTGTSAASTQVTINVSGNVGIGTTAPNEKLEVAGAISATGATAGLSAQGHSTTLAVSSGVSYLYAVDWGAEFKPLSVQGKTISLETGTGSTSARVTIDNAGNVGIGTTAPTSVLHVNGANNTAPVRIQAGDNANYYFSGNSTSGYAVDFLINNTAFYIGHNSASRDFTFKTNSIDRVTIKGDGNVGIGTTAPTQLLSVAGNTDLGNSIGSVTSSTYTTRLSGYALYYDASNRYGNYGVLLLNSDSGWTSSAKRFMITNGYNANRFAIIRSVDATTDPALGYGGSVTSGTVDFEINSAGAATFGSSVTTGGSITAAGDYIQTSNSVFTNTAYELYLQTDTAKAIIFRPNATEQMRITSAGNVGIGTTSPTRGITINKINEFASLNIVKANTANQIVYLGTGSSGPDDLGILQLYDGGVAKVQLYTGGNSYFTGGNVGIGTTAPDAKLVIVTGSADDSGNSFSFTGYSSKEYVSISKLGFIRSRASDLNGANIHFIDNGGTLRMEMAVNTSSMTWYSHALASTFMVFQHTTGNVGIGTTSPGAKLEVDSASTLPIIRARYNASYYTDYDSNGIQFVGIGQNFNITDNGSSVLYLKSGGNVGIGTTSPIAKLHISSAGNPAAAAIMGDSKLVISGVDGNMDLFSQDDNSTVACNIGFGRFNGSTGALIHKFGITSWANTGSTGSNTGDRIAFNYGTSQDIWGNSELMTIKANGNVGIGTTAPGQKLTVYHNESNVLGIYNSEAAYGTGQLKNIDFYGRWWSGDPTFMQFQARISCQHSEDGYRRGNLKFYTVQDGSLVDAMTILYNGNVGIGTANPGHKLQVQGTVVAFSAVGSGDNVRTGLAHYDTTAQAAGVGGQLVLGYKYIGDTDYTEGAIIKMYKEDGTSGNFGSGLRFQVRNNGANLSTKLVLDPSGNLGVNTTAPTAKLHVEGPSGDGTPVFRVNGTTAPSSFNYAGSLMNSDLGSSRNTILLIGKAQSNRDSGYIGFNHSGTNGSNSNFLTFGLFQNDNIMNITGAGNVGIGTTTPSYKLDVVGDARITSGSLGVGVAPNATDGRIDASNDIVAYQTSDQRLKENVTPIENALEKVKSLTGVEFDWIEEHKHIHGYEGHDTGIIAQQVQAVMPTAVRTNDSGYLSVRYEKMIALLIEGMKEQQNQIDELKAKLNDLTC
jgi:hypothetical protein